MKMGCTITSESHAERSIATQFELDPGVLEYWEQPPTIEVLTTDKRGSRRRRPYTADFLVLSSTGPVVKEVKTLEEVEMNRHQFARHLLVRENDSNRGVYEQQTISRRI